MEIRTARFEFGVSNEYERNAEFEFIFDKPITKATALIIGTSYTFSHGEDHHIEKLIAQLKVDILGETAKVIATFGIQDNDHNDFEGSIDYSLIVDF